MKSTIVLCNIFTIHGGQKMKRKMIGIVLITAMFIGCMTGCESKSDKKESVKESSSSKSIVESEKEESQSKKEETPEKQEEITGDLFDYKVLFNGEIISIPVSESEMLSKGWNIDSRTKQSVSWLKNDDEVQLFDFGVNGDEEVAYSASFAAASMGGDYTVKSVNNITLFKSTKDDVIAAYGEPDEIIKDEILVYYEFPETSMKKSQTERFNKCNLVAFYVEDRGIVNKILLKRPEDMN